MSVVPLASAAEVAVAVQFGYVPPNTMLAADTKPVFVLVADKLAEVHNKILSWSSISNEITAGVSSFVAKLEIGVIVGASFTAFTVILKVLIAVIAGIGEPVSVTINVIVVGPPF